MKGSSRSGRAGSRLTRGAGQQDLEKFAYKPITSMSRSERAKLRNLKRGGASSDEDGLEGQDQDQDQDQDQEDIENDDQDMRDDQIAEDMDDESGSEIQDDRRNLNNGNESSDSVQEIRKPVGRSTRRGRAAY